MGGLFSTAAPSSPSSVKAPTKLAEELRLALRVGDGPFAADAAGEARPNASPIHRCERVLELLRHARRSDVITEHMLELVDGNWSGDGGHRGTLEVIAQLVLLADTEQLHVLATTCLLYQRCWAALDIALQELLRREQRVTSDRKIVDDDCGDEQTRQLNLSRLFVHACQAAPLSSVEKVLRLGWIDRQRGFTADEQFRQLMMRLCAMHRPLLSPEEKIRRRLEKERAKKSNNRTGGAAAAASPATASLNLMAANEREEEEKLVALKKKLGAAPPNLPNAGGADDDDDDNDPEGELNAPGVAACRLLTRFLRAMEQKPVSSKAVAEAVALLPIPAADDATTAAGAAAAASSSPVAAVEQDGVAVSAAVIRAGIAPESLPDMRACDMLRGVLAGYVSWWSQIAATVGETPLSWKLAPERTRRYVVVVALSLKKRGLTFPGWCKVLSFLCTPNMEL